MEQCIGKHNFNPVDNAWSLADAHTHDDLPVNVLYTPPPVTVLVDLKDMPRTGKSSSY